jgi:antitoxin component of MazEF toxin-antitoxin module
MSAQPADLPQVWKVRLDSRRRPTLPEEAMRAAGFSPGEDLRVRVAEEGLLILETPAHALARARSRVAGVPRDRSYVDEFLAERQAEAMREL